MNESQIQIYKSKEGQTEIQVILENDTVWLTQKHMAIASFSAGKRTNLLKVQSQLSIRHLTEKTCIQASNNAVASTSSSSISTHS